MWNNSKRVNHQNFGRFSHSNPKSNIVPQAVLTKSGLVSLNTAKSVSTAQSRTRMNDVMQKPDSIYKAYSSDKRPFNKKTTNYNRYFNKRVNTVKSTRVNTARPKAEVNTVKASTSWVWKPKHEELDHVFKSNSASNTLTRYDYVDALGRFKKREVLDGINRLSCASDVVNKSGIHTIRPRFYSTDTKKKKLDTPDHTIRALKNTAPMNIKNEETEIGPVDVEWNKAIGNRMKKQRSGYKRDDVVLLVHVYKVRILQKSQKNGQNQTNTNTGTELSVQKLENAIKVNKSQPMVNSGQP
ncbi:hypothetical protein Tco_0550813 [Tanacetum coccineum]